MSQQILVDDYSFNGVHQLAALATAQGKWASKITKTSGSPTAQGASASDGPPAVSGGLALALDSTVEVQNVCLYNGDILPYRLADLVQVDIWASMTASQDSHVTAAFGMTGARNDAFHSITQRALFKLNSANALVAESADGTNTQNDVATGLTLSTTMRRHVIAFKEGIVTQAGALSTGGLTNIYFSAENGRGQLRRVAATKQFNISAGTNGMQFFAQIQKTSNAAVGTLTIFRVRVAYRLGPNP